jgi:cytidylate kinase
MNSIVVVVGRSCVGKSALTSALSQEAGFVRISFGDLLRQTLSSARLQRALEGEHGFLRQTVTDLFSRHAVSDNSVHLVIASASPLAGHPSEHASRLASFFPVFEQAMLRLIRDQAAVRPVVVDGRSKAIELLRGYGLSPFCVLLDCDEDTRFQRFLSQTRAKVTPETVEVLRQELRRRDEADSVHAPSLDVRKAAHLVIDGSRLSVSEECGRVLQGLANFKE